MTETYGPIISFVPLTEYPGNIVGLWLDLTPVGGTAQFCIGQQSLVVGYLFKHPRPGVGFHSRGWASWRRPRRLIDDGTDS